ncbi:pectate lyase, partial [bacterium AH-315-N03]|nr:pectate lyase [bacterium AH-315-N03]
TTEFMVPAVMTEAAPDALSRVLDSAGARPWSRDSVDLRIVADVRAGSGRIVDSVSEAGGYPSVARGTRVVDGDRDGMPDAFERSHGTDPARADNNGDIDGDGYTNLEGYLHWASRIGR